MVEGSQARRAIKDETLKVRVYGKNSWQSQLLDPRHDSIELIDETDPLSGYYGVRLRLALLSVREMRTTGRFPIYQTASQHGAALTTDMAIQILNYPVIELPEPRNWYKNFMNGRKWYPYGYFGIEVPERKPNPLLDFAIMRQALIDRYVNSAPPMHPRPPFNFTPPWPDVPGEQPE